MSTFLDEFTTLDAADWREWTDVNEGTEYIQFSISTPGLKAYLNKTVSEDIVGVCHLNKLFSGNIEIITKAYHSDITPQYGSYFHRLKVFNGTGPYKREESPTFDIGYGYHEWYLDNWAAESFYRKNSDERLAWTVSHARTGAAHYHKLVVNPQGDLYVYEQDDSEGFNLIHTFLGYFPPNSVFEFIFGIQGLKVTTAAYTNQYTIWDSVTVTADTIVTIPDVFVGCVAESFICEGTGGPGVVEAETEPFDGGGIAYDPAVGFIDDFFLPEIKPEWARAGEYQSKTDIPEPTLSAGTLDFLGEKVIEDDVQFYLNLKTKGDFVAEAYGQMLPGDHSNLLQGFAVIINGQIYWCNLSQVNSTYLALRLSDYWGTGNVWGQIYTPEWDGLTPRDFTIRFELVGNQLKLYMGIDGLPLVLKTTQTVTTASEYVTEFCCAADFGNAGWLLYNFSCIAIRVQNGGVFFRETFAELPAEMTPLTANMVARVNHVPPAEIHVFFWKSGLIGGGADDLDGIDPYGVDGTHYQLTADSAALVVEPDNTIGLYLCRDSGGVAGDPPSIIIPAVNPGNFYWERVSCPQLQAATLLSFDGLGPTPKPFDYELAGNDIYWTEFSPSYNNAASANVSPLITVDGISLASSSTGRFNFICIPQRIKRVEVP